MWGTSSLIVSVTTRLGWHICSLDVNLTSQRPQQSCNVQKKKPFNTLHECSKSSRVGLSGFHGMNWSLFQLSTMRDGLSRARLKRLMTIVQRQVGAKHWILMNIVHLHVACCRRPCSQHWRGPSTMQVPEQLAKTLNSKPWPIRLPPDEG